MINPGRYSSQFKAEAVRSVIDTDRPISWIARKLKVSPSSLRRWMFYLEDSLRAEREAVENKNDSVGQDPGIEFAGVPLAEFKERALRLAREDGRPVAEVARGLGVTPSTLLRWQLESASAAEPVDTGEVTAGVKETESVVEGEARSDPGGAAASVQGNGSSGRPNPEEAPAVVTSDQGSVGPPTRLPAELPASSGGEVQPSSRVGVVRERSSSESVDREARYPGAMPTMEAPEHPSERRRNSVDLSELLDVLRRRALLVIATTVACTAGAVFFALQETPTYRATAVLRLGGAGREAITRGFEAPIEEGDRYVNPLLSQTELLRSRSLIAEVVDSVGYRLRPDYDRLGPNVVASVRVAPNVPSDTLWVDFEAGGVSARIQSAQGRAGYGQPLSVGGLAFTVPTPQEPGRSAWRVLSREEAVDRMLAQLRISPRVETNIIDVSFIHPSPTTAQSVVNTLILGYQQFEADFSQDRSRRRRLFLEEQVAQTDSSLARAQFDLRNFQSNAQTYDARQELSSQQQNRMLLDIRRGELDADRRMFQGLLTQLDSTAGEGRWEVLRTLVSAPGIAENAAVSRIHEQLILQRAVLDSLTTGAFGSSDSNPDVLRQQQLIATSERELSGAIRSHVASLDARAVALDELAERTSEELSGLPYQLAEEARLQQIVATYQSVSDQVRGELQRSRVAEAATVGQVDVIDLAALPYETEPGTRAIKIAIGLLVGLTFGFGSAFALERGNRVVQTRTEVEEAFQVPVLGVIPKAVDSDFAELERRLSTNVASGGDWEVADRPSDRTGSRAMEAYRLLRTNLLFASWTGGARSIVVTSTVPQEGKTLTSASLAASMAEEGVRVLLVDADLWRGRIHDMAGAPESPGLADVLAGRAQASDAIRRTGLATLDFLPRGTGQPDPSSLAKSSALGNILDQLGREYDTLVVDAPPVLAAGNAPVLPAVADGVLLVVRAGQTEREALREALRALGTVGASVLGVVLNDPEELTAWADRRYYARYEYAQVEA